MFDDLDADDLFAELIMLRSNDARGFIVVEGTTDCAVLDRFVDERHFTTVPAHGKQRALGAVARIRETRRLTAVFAILDRDWVGLPDDDTDAPDADIVYTEYYDLDACIFFTPAVYESLAAVFCTDQTFKYGASGCSHQDIVQGCVTLALPVGVLRYISHRDGLGLNLGDFPLVKVAHAGRGTVDAGRLVELASHRASKKPDEHRHLVPVLEAAVAAVAQPDRYCSGHDLAKAFALVAKHRWGSHAGADMVERAARAAYPREAFEKSSIFRDSADWLNDAGQAAWRTAAT